MADEILVSGEPTAVRSRINTSLVPIRSLWYPAGPEVEAWRETSAFLYVRWTGPQSFEIGPRTASLNAARLCPVWRGMLLEAGHGRTRLTLSRTMPRSTLILLGIWGAVLVVWAAILFLQYRAGDPDVPGWAVWWGVLAALLVSGIGVGWGVGGQQLIAHRDWLEASITR